MPLSACKLGDVGRRGSRDRGHVYLLSPARRLAFGLRIRPRGHARRTCQASPTACDHGCTSTSPPLATPESGRCKPPDFIENRTGIRPHTTPLSAALKLPTSNGMCHSDTPWERL
jgi:hypothetical protein